jgi:hypothetical protein
VNCALVLTPTERRGVVDVSAVPALLQRFSIGISRARRIVVPPELLAQAGEKKVRADILQLRTANDELVALVHEVRDLHLMASRVFGIELAFDDAGRIPHNVSL